MAKGAAGRSADRAVDNWRHAASPSSSVARSVPWTARKEPVRARRWAATGREEPATRAPGPVASTVVHERQLVGGQVRVRRYDLRQWAVAPSACAPLGTSPASTKMCARHVRLKPSSSIWGASSFRAPQARRRHGHGESSSRRPRPVRAMPQAARHSVTAHWSPTVRHSVTARAATARHGVPLLGRWLRYRGPPPEILVGGDAYPGVRVGAAPAA
jgi:hypothetical protein